MRALEADEFTKQSDAERMHESGPVGRQRKKRKRGSITYSILKKYDFNLSDKLGTVIHRSRKFDFNRLEGIQYAYSVVFGESVRGVLRPHYTTLSLLEAARNLLVHRGGEIDPKFRERVQKSDVFGRLEDGDPLMLDGEIVQRFASAVFACGVDLLTKIDAVVAAEGDADDK
ncbi:MAG: hypothetical protein ABGY75_03330 [Gemmataceae bacterium]